MISVRDLTVNYETPGETITVLDGLNLEIADGQAIAVVGPSGSGKTTLLNVLGAMLPATSGEVIIGGKDIAGLKEKDAASFRNQELGFIFQQHHLLPQLTVLENVLVPRLAGGWKEEEKLTRGRAKELLERVGLGHRLTHLPSALSGGEKQRVAVARALINEPSLILADEPTGALDGETGTKVADLLLEVQQEKGVTLMVVTHDLDFAARVSGEGDMIHLT
jgi:lipoprotein-releasing system ATP-binding protein